MKHADVHDQRDEPPIPERDGPGSICSNEFVDADIVALFG